MTGLYFWYIYESTIEVWNMIGWDVCLEFFSKIYYYRSYEAYQPVFTLPCQYPNGGWYTHYTIMPTVIKSFNAMHFEVGLSLTFSPEDSEKVSLIFDPKDVEGSEKGPVDKHQVRVAVSSDRHNCHYTAVLVETENGESIKMCKVQKK